MELSMVLIRAGMTEEGERNIRIGRRDKPLSSAGRNYLFESASAGIYPAVSLVYTSPMIRCLETAACIYPRSNATVAMTGLQPFDLGPLEGQTNETIQKSASLLELSGVLAADNPSQGESLHHFSARCARIFRQIADEMASMGLERVAVVTHRLNISVILQRFCVPRSSYRDWHVRCGGGYQIVYNSSLSTAKVVTTI